MTDPNLNREWADTFQELATIDPGAFAGREPLTLYRCLRCWSVVTEDDRPLHHNAAVHR